MLPLSIFEKNYLNPVSIIVDLSICSEILFLTLEGNTFGAYICVSDYFVFLINWAFDQCNGPLEVCFMWYGSNCISFMLVGIFPYSFFFTICLSICTLLRFFCVTHMKHVSVSPHLSVFQFSRLLLIIDVLGSIFIYLDVLLSCFFFLFLSASPLLSCVEFIFKSFS